MKHKKNYTMQGKDPIVNEEMFSKIITGRHNGIVRQLRLLKFLIGKDYEKTNNGTDEVV